LYNIDYDKGLGNKNTSKGIFVLYNIDKKGNHSTKSNSFILIEPCAKNKGKVLSTLVTDL